MKQLDFYSDKGHDSITGKDPGAVNGSLREGSMNIVTATAFHERIQQHGHRSKLEPGDLSINASATAANAWGADFCISWHYNAGGGDRGEVIHSWDDQAAALAKVVGVGLNNAGQSKVNVVKCKPNSAGNAEYFGMLRIPRMPAIIIEPCFIDNAADRQLADTEAEQQKIGICVADAIAAVYGSILNERYKAAVAKLYCKKITNSPNYWLQFTQSHLMAKGDFAASLLQKLTSTSNLGSAISYLANKGVIGSPQYWADNCQTDREVYGGYVQTLIINAVEKLGL